jgi:hypothetical protein
MGKIIKMKDLLKESTWNNRKFGEPLPTMADYKKAHESKKEGKLSEKVDKSKVDKSFNKVIAFVRKEAKKLNDDDLYAMTQKLAKWFK